MTRCPKCKSNLRVPERGEPDSIVRCPRCHRKFARHELVPVPVSVGLPGDDSANESDWQYDVPSESPAVPDADQKNPNQKSEVRRRRYYSRTRLPKNAPPVKKRRRSRKPKTKLTRGDFVKIVLGGLIAFPVAQLILWWGFHRDPLGWGPRVYQTVPFIVPRELRGLESIPMKSSEYVGDPESTLIEGQPFNFGRATDVRVQDSLQKGMPQRGGQFPIDHQLKVPATGSDVPQR
jgi:hypothetical protein